MIHQLAQLISSTSYLKKGSTIAICICGFTFIFFSVYQPTLKISSTPLTMTQTNDNQETKIAVQREDVYNSNEKAYEKTATSSKKMNQSSGVQATSYMLLDDEKGKNAENVTMRDITDGDSTITYNIVKQKDEYREKFLKDRDNEFIAFMEKHEKDSKRAVKEHRLPGLIGIGVEKCGTGALQCMLENHPMLKSHKIRESHYFDLYYGFGLKAYFRFLPKVLDHEIAMEKSPGYFFKNSKIPHRMKKDVPDSKIYLMLCDPVNRTFSDFVQEVWTHKLPQNATYDSTIPEIIRSLQILLEHSSTSVDETAISQSLLSFQKSYYASHIVSEGLYYYHLLRWLKVYNQSEIIILNGEDILSRPWVPVEQVQRALKIPVFITKENFVTNPETGFYSARPLVIEETAEGKKVTYGKPTCVNFKNKGRTRNGHWDHRPADDVVDLVRNFYRKSNERLFKLLGRRFNWQR